MSSVIKLSSPATREFWEISVLYEDEHLLALDKPAGLSTSVDRWDPSRPSLTQLLHAGIAEGKLWARERKLGYLANAHRLDLETSGVLLFAKSKPVLIQLANQFGSEIPKRFHIVIVRGKPNEDQFEVDAKLATHPDQPGLVHVDRKGGKRSRTRFQVLERFGGWALLRCEPLTSRPHQLRIHLRHVGLPVTGDSLYGGQPLLLSNLKIGYRLKPHRTERPLISRAAVHAEQLILRHPETGQEVTITAGWPKDLAVAIKYLRRYAGVHQAEI